MIQSRSYHFKYQTILSTIVVFLCFASGPVFSQTNLRLTPGFGLQSLQWYVKENKNADSRFKAYNFHTTPTFAVSLQLDIKHDWMIFAGWYTYRSKVSFKYGNGSTIGYLTMPPPANIFPLGLQKTIGTHRLFKVNRQIEILKGIFGIQSILNNDRYLLVFRSRLISGVSYDLINSTPGNLSTTNQTNISLFFGLGLQFFNADKDRLQLNFIYSQGSKEISDFDVDYYLNSKIYSGKLGSKGSFFAVQLAYPLQMFKL